MNINTMWFFKVDLCSYGEKLYYQSFTNRKDTNLVFWTMSFGSYWAKVNITLLICPSGFIYRKITGKRIQQGQRSHQENKMKWEIMWKIRKSLLETKVASRLKQNCTQWNVNSCKPFSAIMAERLAWRRTLCKENKYHREKKGESRLRQCK